MERYIIEHCSPTLAGLKTASLFSCPVPSESQCYTTLNEINRELNKKNVFLEVLRRRGTRVLIFVYRKGRLEEALQSEANRAFLSQYGYDCGTPAYCIAHLKQRFTGCNGFPHEIGVFLGYPLEDVVGFIENEGKNSKYSGCWKVYSNKQSAVLLFERFNQCKRAYKKLFLSGKSVVQLTVAA